MKTWGGGVTLPCACHSSSRSIRLCPNKRPNILLSTRSEVSSSRALYYFFPFSPIRTMRLTMGPNVQFKEVFLTQKYLAIAMEYADGGDMFQHVKNRQGLHEHEVHSPVLFIPQPIPSPPNSGDAWNMGISCGCLTAFSRVYALYPCCSRVDSKGKVLYFDMVYCGMGAYMSVL